jgi:hypothetical protein
VLGPRGPVSGARILVTQAVPGESLSSAPCEGFPRLRLVECLLASHEPWLVERVEQRRGEVLVRGEVLSAEDGSFEVSGLEAGLYALWVESTQGVGFRPEVAAGAAPLEVRLLGGVQLSGTVRDEGKAPVPGALVTAVFASHSRFFEALTDAEGRYRLGPLPPGELLMVVSKQGLLAAQEPAMAYVPEVKRDFELLRPRSLKGQVLLNKVPVAGAQVRTRDLGSEERSAVTDGQGRFSFGEVPPMLYELWAWHGANGAFAKAMLEKDDPSGDVVLELKPAVFIEGMVRNEAHEPVKGADVEASWVLAEVEDENESPDEGGGSWDVRTTSTDEQGHYHLGPLRAGEHTLRLTADGYLEHKEEPRELSVGVTAWDFTLERAFAVEGVVVDTTGAAVAEEGLDLHEMGAGQGWALGMTRADGHFSLFVAGKGAYKLKLDGQRVHPQEVEITVPTGPLRIVSERLITLSGEVVDEVGTPMPGAEVGIWLESGAWNDKRIAAEPADGVGRFSLHVAAPGRYRVAAELLSREGVRTASQVVEVSQEGAAPLRLAFEEERRLSGVVVDWRGRPLPKLALQLMSAPRTVMPRRCSFPELCLRTDAEGRFSFARVSGEQVELCVRQEGYSVLERASEGSGCVRLSNDGQEARIVVGRDVFITGRVVHTDGSPVTRFRVNGREVAREDGEISLLIHQPGVERIELSAPGLQTVLRTAPEFPEGSQIEDLGSIVLSP